MKKLLFAFTLLISSIGVAQNSHGYNVFYEAKAENITKCTSFLNGYYSKMKIPEDIEAEFSTLIFKGSNEKATHLISFSSKSSKSLAKFKASLSSPNWDLYVTELLKKVECKQAIASNNTNFSKLSDNVVPARTKFQAWTYKVKDVTNFNNAFKKIVNITKPNSYIGMGDIVHDSDGANIYIL
jgi:hypothetical protein